MGILACESILICSSSRTVTNPSILSLPAHVPSIEQLAPGVLEVIEQSGTKKWFGEYKCHDLDETKD